jgi:hypothetical protein
VHYRFFQSPRRRKSSASYSLRDLLVWVTLICLFVAVKGYELAVFVFATGALTVASDWAATIFSARPPPGAASRKVVRPLRVRLEFRPTQVFLSETVAVTAIYLTLFCVVHLFVFCRLVPAIWIPFLNHPNGIGISLHTMVRSVNGLVAAYLLAHLFGTLLPYSAAQRNDRIPIIAAFSLVVALQLAIS